MSNLIKTLDSGAKVEIQMASFENGHRLLKAVMKEVENINLSLGDMSGDVNESVLNTIKNVAARLISSDLVESALWPCMGVVLYNGQKISRETFENANARADFLPVTKEVMVYNLAPFFKNLNSVLSALKEKIGNVQK